MPYGYEEAETKLETHQYEKGEDGLSAVFTLGSYKIRVQIHDENNQPKVTYSRDDRYRSSDPRKTFPNMEVRDGMFILPVEDLTSEILSRCEPKDLARALWANDEVKAEFMYCMTERYTDGAFNNQDRREFLHKIQVAILADATSNLSDRFAESEFNFCKMKYFWDQVNAANQTIKIAEDRVRQCLGHNHPDYSGDLFTITRIKEDGSDPLTKIGGTAWNESRDYWRAKISELFPDPEAPTL